MKVERAQVHLDALNRELDDFLKEPYTVTRRDDTKSGRHIKRTQMKAFPPVLGMLLGEFLYCLRSGLDQMAWHLALPAARKERPGAIYFPIFESIAKGEDKRNYAKVLKLFPDGVAHEIDALQPHKGPGPPQDHPLWQLNKLCNLDKHSLIPIHSRSADVFFPNNPALLVQHLDGEDAIEVSVPIEDKNQLDLQPDLYGPIEFGEWNSDFIIPRQRLADIYGFFTGTVIPKFTGFMLAAEEITPLRFTNPREVY